MPHSVQLSTELVAAAKQMATLHHRSVPKQIEYWSRIGRVAEQNPDLPFQFLTDVLIAREEPSEPFDFR